MSKHLWGDLRGIYIIWYRDVLRFWRDRARLVAALGQPVLFLFVLGAGLSPALSGADGQGFGGLESYVTFLFPGVLGMTVLFTSVFSAMSVVWDREFGFLKEVLVAPVSRGAVTVGKALGGSTQAMLQGTVVLLLAPLAGVRLTPLLVLEVLPLLFLLAFTMTSLGILVASRLRTMEGFQVIMNFLIMPMFFLSGALFPLQGLPAWLTVLTRLDPVTYGVDPLRRVILAASGVSPEAVAAMGVEILGYRLPILVEVAVLGVLSVVFLTAAMRAFAVAE